MKKFLLVLGMAVSISVSQAQITLNQSNMSLPTSTTKLKIWDVIKGATIATPATGANQAWSYPNLIIGTADSFSLEPNTNSAFPSTAVDINTQVNIAPAYYIYGTEVKAEDANGLYIPGWYFTRTSYSLQSYTGSPSDSLIAPTQTILYKNRQNVIAYPATFKSSWRNTDKTTLNFKLTIGTFGLNKAACEKVSSVSVYDSVVGWGTLSIPSSNNGSIPYPVLMVKQIEMSTDSYYVGTSPAPQPLLSAFQISQNGATTTDYKIYFYAADRLGYLMYMDYGTDNTYSNPVQAYYSQDNVTSGIENPENNLVGFSEYPNPAHGSFNCKLIKTNPAQWTLSLVNTLGQTVKIENLKGSGNLEMPVDINGLKSGLYIMNIADENGAVKSSSKIEIR